MSSAGRQPGTCSRRSDDWAPGGALPFLTRPYSPGPIVSRAVGADRGLVGGGPGGEGGELRGEGVAELRGVADLDWTLLSPAAEFAPGERTGKFRLGGDTLMRDESGRSHLSMEDYAIAVLDELEQPRHFRQRFSIVAV